MHEADEAEAAEVLRWLTQEDPHTRQDKVREIQFARTGQWLLDSPEFKRWLADEQQTLFCPGLPGSGKTVITSMVIDALYDTFQADSSIGIAFFYCDYKREDQLPEKLLRSILQQPGRPCHSLPATLLDLYQHHAASSIRPSVAELFEVLASVVASLSKVYIVIDALDELSCSHRRVLLSELFTLQRNSKVNLFTTSRFLPDIVSRFEGIPSLEIGGENTASDFDRFIEQSIRRLPEFVQKSPDLRDKVKKSVLGASDGM
jgi:Cdc6-like AAA superfamily ATPase